jgi:arylsulfatase A-like enzyme
LDFWRIALIMSRTLSNTLTAALLLACWTTAIGAESRPNFLIIMADDMGYSDAGSYGGEISTPNLDSLAARGLRFTDFYNTGRCWPTRGALLTGYYPQQIRRDGMPGVDHTNFGGRGVRPEWAQLLPDRLRPLGYRTYHSGKWHIDGKPIENGFDHSYEPGSGNNFFRGTSQSRDGVKLPQVEPGNGFYGPVAVADHAVEFLREHAEQYADRPFLQYLAFHAPHFPLHALPEDIARYRDRYLEGWDRLRQERHNRQKLLGIGNAALSELEPDVGPPYDFPESIDQLGSGEVNRPLPWSELTEEQRRFQATKMAIHAAMIDRMDRETGRVLDQLRAMQAFDNTVIFFLSDNGASAEIMVRGDGHDPSAPMGSAKTYLCLGPGFSSAGNTPFRRHKTWVHEGGISTPFIVHWPAGIEAESELRSTAAHVIDVVPTVLELAGAKPTAIAGAPPIPGRSLVRVFAGDKEGLHDAIWFYHEGNRGLRQGDWKIVHSVGARTWPARDWVAAEDAKPGEWALYDLSTDRAEQHDLAARHPERVRSMAALWAQWKDRFIRDAGNPAVTSNRPE